MAKAENIEKTVMVGLKVGVTAAVYTVGAETVLNRTALSDGAKAGAVAATGVVGGLALAGYAPHMAAGLIVGSVVYASQSASRAARLQEKVDKLFSQKLADAQQSAAPAAPAATPGTAPSTGLPGYNVRQLGAPAARPIMPRVTLRQAVRG